MTEPTENSPEPQSDPNPPAEKKSRWAFAGLVRLNRRFGVVLALLLAGIRKLKVESGKWKVESRRYGGVVVWWYGGMVVWW